MSRVFLGILLLGCVASLPELAVGVTAWLAGTPLLSVNDLLGSAAVNVVILALADAVIGRRSAHVHAGYSGCAPPGRAEQSKQREQACATSTLMRPAASLTHECMCYSVLPVLRRDRMCTELASSRRSCTIEARRTHAWL